jgi:hypothetical protein
MGHSGFTQPWDASSQVSGTSNQELNGANSLRPFGPESRDIAAQAEPLSRVAWTD